jgi:hypothetical protein
MIIPLCLNFVTSFASVVDTGVKFATGVNNDINHNGSKFAIGVNDTGGK